MLYAMSRIAGSVSDASDRIDKRLASIEELADKTVEAITSIEKSLRHDDREQKWGYEEYFPPVQPEPLTEEEKLKYREFYEMFRSLPRATKP